MYETLLTNSGGERANEYRRRLNLLTAPQGKKASVAYPSQKTREDLKKNNENTSSRHQSSLVSARPSLTIYSSSSPPILSHSLNECKAPTHYTKHKIPKNTTQTLPAQNPSPHVLRTRHLTNITQSSLSTSVPSTPIRGQTPSTLLAQILNRPNTTFQSTLKPSPR